MNEPSINATTYTHIIGVFRAREQADKAIAALKEAAFAESGGFYIRRGVHNGCKIRRYIHLECGSRRLNATRKMRDES